jgi:hypothetical protein
MSFAKRPQSPSGSSTESRQTSCRGSRTLDQCRSTNWRFISRPSREDFASSRGRMDSTSRRRTDTAEECGRDSRSFRAEHSRGGEVAAGDDGSRGQGDVASNAERKGDFQQAAAQRTAVDHAEPLVPPPRPALGLSSNAGCSHPGDLWAQRGREPLCLVSGLV